MGLGSRIADRGSRIGRAAVGTALLIAALVPGSCRTGRPSGSPISPLSATTREAAIEQLRARRAGFRGAKSLMRVRATTGGKTQSFRAQLVIHDPARVELIAYTPVGTTALTLSANGQQVSVRNHLEGEEWEGSAGELARTLGFLDSPLVPAEMAMLIIGIPPREEVALEVEPGGIRRAVTGEVVVAFDPAVFPAQSVVITRGEDRVEIQHLEIVE